MKILDKVGVCARLQDNASGYGDIARVKRMLDYLGLDTVRTGAIQYVGASSWRNIEKAAGLGIRMLMTVRAGRSPEENVADMVRFAAKFPGILIGIEGPNEVDHNPVCYRGVTDLKKAKLPIAALAYQADLARAIRAAPVLAGVPLLNFSDIVQEKQLDAEFVNTHPYPRKGALLSKALPSMLKTWTKRPIIISETGRPSAPDKTFYPVADEAAQVAYLRDAIPAVLAQPRIARMFIYQLMDNYVAPAGGGGMEFHFGLFRFDGTPKPAADAVASLTR